ncbi:hypothetical protein ACIBUY_34890 [Streptomyces sp. NPDC050085]|uniref:hypothetical protein n=1 Tax=Streptomyces sp. NPDC050085 TaxID=3365600 RepID=UPI00378AE565
MSGDTYNTFFPSSPAYFSSSLLGPSAATPRRVAEDQLERLRQQFARPKGMNAAYDTLASQRTVFLDGPPGCGRSAAARVLLCELPSDRGTYHELSPEVGEGPCLSTALIGIRDRMLLDLSTADEHLWQAVRHELSGFRHELLHKYAFLAVVLPQNIAYDLPSEFVRTTIDRPDEKEALFRHLRSRGLDDSLWTPLSEQTQAYLDLHPAMEDLARLAGRIAEARAARSGSGTFDDWLRAALATQGDHRAELDRLVPGLQEGRQRALLLATALLDDAPAQAVHGAATLLLRRVGSADDSRPVLEQAGLTERLEPLHARLTPEGRVRFEQRDFAEATLRYFWANLPHFREPLREWICATLRSPALTAEVRARMVGRFTALHLSTGETKVIIRQIERWTADGAPRTTDVTAAAESLKHCVLDEEHGRAFQHHMYLWSLGHPTDLLREVLVEVCEKVLSIHHPDAALVRLHHLARREPNPPGVATRGLLRFVDQDAGVQRRFLFRLATSRNSEHHRPDARLFLQLPELPTGFLTQRSPREWLTTCWQRVFELPDPQEWAPAARAWLLRADDAQNTRLTDAALKILVDASVSRYPVVSRLYAESRRATSPALAARLLRAINEAQSAAFSARAREPEVSPT